jgi:hypothetical protein
MYHAETRLQMSHGHLASLLISSGEGGGDEEVVLAHGV